MKKTAIDLFSGCGGLTLGLKRAGFKVVGAVELDVLASSTYRLNNRRVKLLSKDIRSVAGADLLHATGLKKGELDLLAGCPPCQGFSSLRTMNGRRAIDEPQNDLVFEFLRLIAELKPRAVMMENVPGLITDPRLQRVRDEMHRLGYSTEARVLNAADFGVPQRRKRMILVGVLDGEPEFAALNRRKRTIRQAIGHFEQPGLGDDPLHDYEVKRSHRVEEIIRAIPKDGGSRSSIPASLRLKCHQKADGFKDVYGRMRWSTPGPTMTGGCINPSKGRFLHPEQDRPITLREAAAIQGFPRNYRFDLSRGRYPAAQMIGNAFPPKFAEHHARVLHTNLKQRA